MTIRELYELAIDQLPMEMDGIHQIELQGWIRTNRASKNVGFIELNDGTYLRMPSLFIQVNSRISKMSKNSS